MSPRKLQNRLKQESRTEESVWIDYRNEIVNNFADSKYQDLSDHLLREFNRKIFNFGLSDELLFKPFDGGFRFLGDKVIDPDAAAYIALVEGAGVTVSGVQRSALDTFIRAEKAASRWDLHKRLYLPIWAQATANAICLRSLTSGTFVGGVNQDNAGYVQGNGTSGRFDWGSSPNGLGISHGNETWGVLQLARNTTTSESMLSVLGASSNGWVRLDWSTATTFRARLRANNISVSSSASGREYSFYSVRSQSLSSRDSYIIKNGEAINQGSNTSTETTTGNAANVTLMAFNNNGVFSDFSDAEFGACFGSDGMSESQLLDFTLNLQTLWETATNLTLPT